MNNSNRKFYLAGTIFTLLSLCFGVPGPLIIKYIAAYMDFWTQNFLRYAVTVLVILPLVWFSPQKNLFNKDLWRKTILIAIINILMQCFFGAAFYYIDPAFITLLSRSSVLWTISLALLFFKDERPLLKSYSFWASFFIVIIGVIGVTAFKHDFSTRTSIIGIILTLGFAFFWAVYTIMIKALLKNEDSTVSFGIVSVYTTVGLGILAFCFGKPASSLNFSLNVWSLLILSSLTSIFASHVTFYSAIKRIGSSIPTLVSLAHPFLVLVFSHIIFNEYLNAAQWFFGILLIAGAALAIKAQEHLNKI